MVSTAFQTRLHRRLIDTLYVDAMVLADEARGYFDEAGRIDRDRLDPITRVAFSCESLRVTTRLMHIIAWILTQRAVTAGELSADEALDPARRLGTAVASDPSVVAQLPRAARQLVDASNDLYRRVARIDAAQAADEPPASPARSMQRRLAGAF